MPIYQYKCNDCGHQMEELQKMSDPKLVDCPSCQAPELEKQLTSAAFKLKGTGWYETDFKNSGKPPAAASKASNLEQSKTKSASTGSNNAGSSSAES